MHNSFFDSQNGEADKDIGQRLQEYFTTVEEIKAQAQAVTTDIFVVCSSLWKNIVTVGEHKKNIMNATGALTDNFQWLLPVPRKQNLSYVLVRLTLHFLIKHLLNSLSWKIIGH